MALQDKLQDKLDAFKVDFEGGRLEGVDLHVPPSEREAETTLLE